MKYRRIASIYLVIEMLISYVAVQATLTKSVVCSVLQSGLTVIGIVLLQTLAA